MNNHWTGVDKKKKDCENAIEKQQQQLYKSILRV